MLGDDFADQCELLVVCMILQKQIDHIGGNKDNIIIPSVAMHQLRQRREAAGRRIYRDEWLRPFAECFSQYWAAREEPGSSSITGNVSSSIDVEMSTPSEAAGSRTNASSPTVVNAAKNETGAGDAEEKRDLSPANPCLVCLTEEKHLACIPCGHLVTCVPCGHSLRICPICRRRDRRFRTYLFIKPNFGN